MASMACKTCRNPSLVVYEEMAGGFICSGCGVVLSQSMIVEGGASFDEETNANGVFVSQSSGASAMLSQSATSQGTRISSASTQGMRNASRRRKVKELCLLLQLPSWSTDAVLLLTKRLPHWSDASLAACLYAVSRRAEQAYSLADICRLAHLSSTKASTRALFLLGPSTSRPERFVPDLVARLNGEFTEQRRARSLLEFMSRRGISAGRRPIMLAGAAVWLAVCARPDDLGPMTLPEAAQAMAVHKTSLYKRVHEVELALVRLTNRVLSLQIVRQQLHLHLAMLLDELDLIAEQDVAPPADRTEADAYQDALRLPPTKGGGAPLVDESSDSDVESMSEHEADQYVRSDAEVQDLIDLQRSLARSPM